MLKKLLNIEKGSSKEFWFSHLMILFSTVLAVYLAASAGLKTAVSFEIVQSDRNSYYLQSSLLDEFKDNTDLALKISNDCLDEEGDRNGKRKLFQYLGKDKHRIDTFVWKAMQYSSETFEIPNSILTGVRRYNILADRVISLISKAEYGRTWNYNYKSQVLTLLKETEEAKSKLVPIMQKEINRLAKRVEDHGVDLNYEGNIN